jgi:hypothetical protein
MRRVTPEAFRFSALLAFWLFALLSLALLWPEPLKPRAVPSADDLVVFQPGALPEPIVTVNRDRRTVIVTKHAPRDLLVCLRDDDCRLVEEWIGK